MSADRRRPRRMAPRLEPLESRLAPSVRSFLTIDGIQGEARDKDHSEEIDVISWSWGEHNTGTFAAAAPAGRVEMQDFHFTMPVSKASPLLFR
jgi:type VI secretion system secreted protein Hcp